MKEVKIKDKKKPQTAQHTKALAIKSDHLSWILRSHMTRKSSDFRRLPVPAAHARARKLKKKSYNVKQYRERKEQNK